MLPSGFHPAVRHWFDGRFGTPTQAQLQAWPEILAGCHTLLAAPTGSGKTLAAFLAGIDGLVREGLDGPLPNETRVLYVSPLKALSNDVQKNLQEPLAGIADAVTMHAAFSDPGIRAMVRTGDTPQSERARMTRERPHILVTTPESLYLLLTSASGREMLSTVRSVIVDEIHALAGNKRGAHLALSLERLQALTGAPLQRIGLSATQSPIERIAHFLLGARDEDCRIIDTGETRERDMALELPGAPLETIMSNEVFEEIYDRIAALAAAHRTTLVFVNTRRLAERAARHLAERLGEEAVTSHHGSLARKHRLVAEQRLKNGELKALVATASLELGIDIGDVDLVCQLGSPRSISAFLQRVGRSGHAVGQVPKGRLFPLSRDDLVESTALLGHARRGELDRIAVPNHPLDVLSQQIVAEVSAREWAQDELFAVVRRAWPYRDLQLAQFDALIVMLAQGFSTRRGRRGAHLHHDAVNRRLRPRRGARLTALTNGGAIPDQFDYDVILVPESLRIGSLNEDFAFESVPGDIFQLGNLSYRILKVETGRVLVEDARGQPPNIPFWFGEAPGRSDELSQAVSQLRSAVEQRLDEGQASVIRWIQSGYGVSLSAAEQLVGYLAAARAALGALPTQDRLVLERFFDETGDMHLVVHAPFGSRLNRAWGLALRKRFCRKFNFELQAAALEDSLVLSLGPTHSFPLDEVPNYLKSATVRDVLVQALLDAPMFPTHWRWNATIALAVRRNRNGRKVPPQWQRNDAEDLIALVFPDQLACLENIAGKREIPDHPLVEQTVTDCLTGLMDIDGLERLLTRIEAGDIEIRCCDLSAPSPLSEAILSARPYAFLDDAPAEERRTLAVRTQRTLEAADAAGLGRLDSAAIDRVRAEAWPVAGNADELHDALVLLGFLGESEGLAARHPAFATRFPADANVTAGPGRRELFEELVAQRRACALGLPGGARIWCAAERLAEMRCVLPGAQEEPPIDAVGDAPGGGPGGGLVAAHADAGVALREILRSRLEGLGPVTAQDLADSLGVMRSAVDLALAALEGDGFVLRGRYELDDAGSEGWCERRLLARIHRYTIKRMRSEIDPVSAANFQRFLIEWQGLGGDAPLGDSALHAALTRLEGYAAPAGAWERDILPARVGNFTPAMLDRTCASGRTQWLRLAAPGGENQRRRSPVAQTPIALVPRRQTGAWRAFSPLPDIDTIELSTEARAVRNALWSEGALFFEDLVECSELPPEAVEQGLAELVAWGLVNADSFAGLRALLAPRRRRRRARARVEDAGRWVAIRPRGAGATDKDQGIERVALALLRRYGVVFRRVLDREAQIPPWRDLLRVYWRMEARGEIRGGRFVDGFAGEQFALPEAIGLLRDTRRRPANGRLLVVSAADPLNLAGIVLPGERVPALLGNRLLLRDGLPCVLCEGDDLRYLADLDEQTRFDAQSLLLGAGLPASDRGPGGHALA